MIYAFRFCQAQQWQCDVSEYTLPSSPLLAPRTSPPFALCAVPSHPDEGISLAPRVPSRAPSLPLRHFLFFWPVSRGCGAALQCCRHDRRTVSPPSPLPRRRHCRAPVPRCRCCTVAAATATDAAATADAHHRSGSEVTTR